MEYVPKGQRIRRFHIEVTEDGHNWKKVAEEIETTTIGYRRIVPVKGNTKEYNDGILVKGLRLVIDDSKACPVITKLAVY
jgi:alpha-L-fucosidase